jgi:hypothetical protein
MLGLAGGFVVNRAATQRIMTLKHLHVLWFGVGCCLLTAFAPGLTAATTQTPDQVVLRRNAVPLESLAANEVVRYVYLRTGKVLPVQRKLGRVAQVVVTRKDTWLCGERGQGLGPQEFLIQTADTDAGRTWWIIGGDDVGTLYGAYRFIEKLGVQFGLEDDALPDEPLTGAWPEMNERGKPRFALRGLQPFHDFSVGPDWWNAADYRSVVSQMAKLRLNFIGLHTYPSWNGAAGPEANVWIGLPEDVDRRGNVKFGYEAGVVTTRRGWAVTPFATSQYAAGASLLFDADDYGPDFMQGCLEWPKSPEAAKAMFNRYGDFQQQVFGHARRLGVKTCVGTELPLGVPKELAEHLKAKGLDATDPAVVQRLYEGTFLRLMRKTPVDYYWLWVPEVWLSMEPGCLHWEMTSRERTAQDLGLAAAAANSLHVPFGMATCGWRLGTREDPLWMHERMPRNWAISSINTQLGRDPVEAAYGKMPGRQKWVIGWAEDDDAAGAHCCTSWDLQLWVARMLANSAQAAEDGCDGMMAIHWRTAAVSPNFAALARAGWNYESGEAAQSPQGDNASNNVPGADAFWAEWGRGAFGPGAGTDVAHALQKLDGGHLGINALIGGGANTTDQQITAFFAPLREMEALRSQVKGAGNLERLDYWINLVRATEFRVRTWVVAARLTAKMQHAGTIQDAEAKRTFAKEEVLPVRLELARNYEQMIGAFVSCARSPGEVGTIASIESGSRKRLVSAHDKALAGLLGSPLPPEVAVRTAYRGAPRIFVSSKCSQVNTKEPLEIRPFVLSADECKELKLHWRPLGKSAFKTVVGARRARQAYTVSLPGQSAGIVEYYLEAKLGDGQTLRLPTTAPERCETVIAW